MTDKADESKRQYSEEEKHRLGEEVRKLDEKIKASEGFRTYNKIRNHVISFNIFYGNYFLLCECLDEFKKPAYLIPLFSEQDPDKMDRLTRDIALVVHNFLASAMTLVDHTRIFVDELYAGTAFETEYEKQKDKHLKRSSVVQFVHELRHYTLHRKLPITTTKINFKRNSTGSGFDLKGSISLNVNDLREWDGWNATSREYLNTLGDKVEVREVADQYFSVIKTFYNWFEKRQNEVHRATFKDLKESHTELRHVHKKWLEAWGNDKAPDHGPKSEEKP